jgi:tRNA-specific 2-thiouridylase
MAGKKVAIALSGGVDSAVAAYLLKESGYDVLGIHMLLCDVEKERPAGTQYTGGPESVIEHLKRFCRKLDIPFHVLDLRHEFKDRVIDSFYGEYVRGRTPNPCIVCNYHIKFGLCLEKALDMGADRLATGHYARIVNENGLYRLLKGADNEKDQSYFLYRLDQKRLARILFPLGTSTKSDAGAIAQYNEFEVAGNRSSQDICFITGRYGEIFRHSSAVKSGDIVNSNGDKLGRHSGLAFYTIGQRHGLGIASGSPLYVTGLEPDGNRITVGNERELYRHSLIAKDINWISGTFPARQLDITAKIRYRSPEVAATVFPEHETVRVHFEQPQRAVAPGQSIVFYQGDEVIGGGIIEH